jgi:hypothetical protein
MPSAAFSSLANQKYISLETFRRSGQGVRTPVWFAEQEEALYVYSEADAGKVKRIRANPRVRIAACGFAGKLRGPWLEAVAQIVTGEEERRGHALLNQKYRPWKSIGDVFSRLRGRRQVILVIRMQ